MNFFLIITTYIAISFNLSFNYLQNLEIVFGFILLGSFLMIIGLYAVSWAKSTDLGEIK